jgi:hypothetical protein
MSKTLLELRSILAETILNAPKKEKVIKLYLFGIKYADDIKKFSIREVIENSNIPQSYQAEMNKAVNLAKYVSIK